ncbi:MAG: hypothetical protein R3242_06400 [Akkermansiaceae bacterium]|nr:hypothetical protein [Akkermansiaceae bacterium]
MKPGQIALIALMAIVIPLGAVGIRMTIMKDVPADEFSSFIADHGSQLGGRRVSAPTSLPLLISIRFPQAGGPGGLGFPDRTEVFDLISDDGLVECHAHIRHDQVCMVTFERFDPSPEFRKRLSDRFPGLTVK